MDTTYEPDKEVTYSVDSYEVEDWIEEQFGIPFNVAADLQPDASPDGEFKLDVTGEFLDDYEKSRFEEFMVEHQGKEYKGYEEVSGNMRTRQFMTQLAKGGHIPEGTYVISFSY